MKYTIKLSVDFSDFWEIVNFHLRTQGKKEICFGDADKLYTRFKQYVFEDGERDL